jgi:hypothetical protein
MPVSTSCALAAVGYDAIKIVAAAAALDAKMTFILGVADTAFC